jgi:hypothetical protein
MKPWVSFLLVGFALVHHTLWAQDSRVLEVRAEGFPKEAALEKARQQALQRSGIRLLQAFTEVTTASSGERSVSRQVYTGAIVAGLIEAEELLSCKLEVRGTEPDEYPVYTVRMSVRVAPVDPPDPYFSLVLSCTPASTVFLDGETVMLHVTATQECYLMLFTIGADHQLYQVFPNESQSGNFIPANRQFTVKDIRVHAVVPGQQVTERLIALATKRQFPFLDLNDPGAWKQVGGGSLALSAVGEATLLTQWLARLGESQWAMSDYPYTVIPR